MLSMDYSRMHDILLVIVTSFQTLRVFSDRTLVLIRPIDTFCYAFLLFNVHLFWVIYHLTISNIWYHLWLFSMTINFRCCSCTLNNKFNYFVKNISVRHVLFTTKLSYLTVHIISSKVIETKVRVVFSILFFISPSFYLNCTYIMF